MTTISSKAILNLFWPKEDINYIKKLKLRKYSKWDISSDLIKSLINDSAIIDQLHKLPLNKKMYFFKDFYLSAMGDENNRIYGIGCDPDRNIYFNTDEE